jgi:uncharacterized protein YbaA (DUF1428 family)
MHYVDGFVIPVSKRYLPKYLTIARKAARIFKDHGALEDHECVADDLNVPAGWASPFTKIAKAKKGETVIFSWITFKSRKDRDRVNAKVMKDPRMLRMMKEPMPMDPKRMAYGGFKVKVDA